MSPLERGGTIREQRASARTHNFFTPSGGGLGFSQRRSSMAHQSESSNPQWLTRRSFTRNLVALAGASSIYALERKSRFSSLRAAPPNAKFKLGIGSYTFRS